MGKVLVLGRAEKKILPDCCNITITIETKKYTSAMAVKEISDLCEQLLSKLQAVGLNPNEIEIIQDSLSTDREYKSEKLTYQAKKRIKIHSSSESSVINTIKSVIEDGVTGISYNISYSVSNETAIRKQLMKEAITDSRRKADFLAETIGSKIVGVDSANLTGNEDVYDVAEDKEIEEVFEHQRVFSGYEALASGGAYPLSDNLKPEKIELEAEVKIVWLLSTD